MIDKLPGGENSGDESPVGVCSVGEIGTGDGCFISPPLSASLIKNVNINPIWLSIW